MDAIISYLIKSVIASAVLTGYYWLVLRNRKFHHYNRFYLLSALLISLIIPLLHYRLFYVAPPHYPAAGSLLTMIGPGSIERPAAAPGWEQAALACTVLISIVLLTVLFVKIAGIYRIKRRHTPVKMNGFYFIETELKQAPFSFFDNLFWRKSISMEDENGEKIFKHELTHIRERHSYDKLFSQITVCLFWMNPFYWLIQKELNLIHEFIADEQSVQRGDSRAFAGMLLRSHNEGRYLDPSHPFFNSSIKRRLIMITTSRKTPFSYLRRILVLPLVLLVSALFSITVARAQNNPSKSDSARIQKERAEQKERDEKIAYDKLSPEQKEALLKQREIVTSEIAKRKAEAIIKDLPPAIYLINGTESSREAVQKLEPAKIKRVYTLYIGGNKKEDEEHAKSPWGREVIEKYGEKAKSGVIGFVTE